MKKILALAFASTWFLACTDTETTDIESDTRDTSTAIGNPPDNAGTYTPADGDVQYRDDKVHVMRNGQWVVTDDDITLDDGSVVERDGRVRKDDKEIELEEGETVDKTGTFFDRTGRAMENAWADAKEGVRKAGDKIERGAEKAGDKIDNATDDNDKKDKDKTDDKTY